MIDEIFATIAEQYRKGTFSEKKIFYFSIDDTRKTVVFEGNRCSVIDGKLSDHADCVCKMGTELFVNIWQNGYKPGMKEFMNGAIKSNAPHLLQKFIGAFGK